MTVVTNFITSQEFLYMDKVYGVINKRDALWYAVILKNFTFITILLIPKFFAKSLELAQKW